MSLQARETFSVMYLSNGGCRLGLTVITTSSPRNFELLQSLGADHVFDYVSHTCSITERIRTDMVSKHESDCGQKIRSVTNDTLLQVFDTIATPEAAQICANALSSAGSGTYVNLMGVDMPRKDVKNIFYLGYTITGEEFWLEGETWPACKEDFDLGVEVFHLLEDLLREGLVRPHPLDLRKGGLGAVLGGMQELKEGKVSGVKLVYRIET